MPPEAPVTDKALPQPEATGHTTSGLPASGWRRIATVAGAFSFVTLLLMVSSFLTRPAADPADPNRTFSSPELRELKARLVEDPGNDELKQSIRELDLNLREKFFERRTWTRRGAYLLLSGLVVFLVAVRRANLIPHAPPQEPPAEQAPDEDGHEAVLSRRALGTLGAVLGVAGLVWALAGTSGLPEDASAVTAAAYPTQEELLANWPRFRGADASGTAPFDDAVDTWDGAEGTNILWKTAVPRPGWSSPVVWEERVYLSGGDETTREIFAFDGATGELVWRSAFVSVGRDVEIPEVMEDTGHAASTMATDGRRLYAMFATGELGAFDMGGEQLWARNEGPFENAYGHASSLVTHQGLLLVQLDQGMADSGLAKLIAVDVLTGETAWETPREVDASWSTPLVIPPDELAENGEVILNAAPWVISYDLANGEELWRAERLAGEVVTAPMLAGDLVIAMHADFGISAIRRGGRGDVGESHLAWSLDYGAPSISSPALDDGLLYVQEDDGTITCYDTADGSTIWEHEVDGYFNASPSVIGDRLYATNSEGVTYVLRVGREVAELGQNEWGENVGASFAFGNGRVYVRGAEHLFAIGAGTP